MNPSFFWSTRSPSLPPTTSTSTTTPSLPTLCTEPYGWSHLNLRTSDNLLVKTEKAFNSASMCQFTTAVHSVTSTTCYSGLRFPLGSARLGTMRSGRKVHHELWLAGTARPTRHPGARHHLIHCDPYIRCESSIRPWQRPWSGDPRLQRRSKGRR